MNNSLDGHSFRVATKQGGMFSTYDSNQAVHAMLNQKVSRPITQQEVPKNFGVDLTRNLRTIHGNQLDKLLDIPDETLEFAGDQLNVNFSATNHTVTRETEPNAEKEVSSKIYFKSVEASIPFSKMRTNKLNEH